MAKAEEAQLRRDALLFIVDDIYSLIDNADLPEPYQGYDDEDRRPFLRMLEAIQRELRAQAEVNP